jgi:hypothetical protein
MTLAGGCAGSSGDSSPDELERRDPTDPSATTTDVQAPDIPAKLRRKPGPLDAYVDTPREMALLDYAVQVIASDCMKDLGYSVEVPRFNDLVEWYMWDTENQGARTFGLTDRGEASVYGYGDAIPPAKPDPDIADRDALVAYRGAGLPDSDDGACRPQAEDEVYRRARIDYNASPLPVRLKIEANDRASARTDYQAVYADLGRCLKDEGYEIPDPERPFASQAMQRIMGGGMDRGYGEPAPKPEVAVALADIGCKERVDLVRRLEEIVAGEEQELIEKNALLLDEYQDEHQSALERATRITEGGTTP